MLTAKEKLIYYSPAGRIQNSEKELINYPPEGYKFITTKVNPLARNSFIFGKLRLNILDRMMPLNLVKAKLDGRIPQQADMVYAYNHIVTHDVSWVVNVEWAHVLVGRYQKYFKQYKSEIEYYLSSDNCKGVFTWTNSAMASIIQGYDISGFQDKLKVIPPAIHSKDYQREYKKDGKLTLLFIGSIDTPEDYYAKGGQEVVESFNLIKHKYPNMELIIRANASAEIYSDVSNIRIIRDILPKTEFEEIFKKADIFILPSHYAQEMVILEAMSWGLPVIASQISTEFIQDGRNGLILRTKPPLNYYNGNFLVSETTKRLDLVEQVKKYDKSEVVDEIVLLIENFIKYPEFMEQLGTSAKQKADYSIKLRNQTLKEVFDNVV